MGVITPPQIYSPRSPTNLLPVWAGTHQTLLSLLIIHDAHLGHPRAHLLAGHLGGRAEISLWGEHLVTLVSNTSPNQTKESLTFMLLLSHY